MPQLSGSGKACRCVSAERLASASILRTASFAHGLESSRSRLFPGVTSAVSPIQWATVVPLASRSRGPLVRKGSCPCMRFGGHISLDVTSLWAKPRQYAHFLGIELGYVYKKPLLVVMPNGIGYYHANHDSKPAYAALRTIQSGNGDQLAQTAIASIAALARQAVHPFTLTPSPHRAPQAPEHRCSKEP